MNEIIWQRALLLKQIGTLNKMQSRICNQSMIQEESGKQKKKQDNRRHFMGKLFFLNSSKYV